jgi:ankyrin repeat protein
VFPRLTERRVFIASPGDVSDIRVAIMHEFDAVQRQLSNDLGIDVYRWEIETGQDGFQDDVPAEEQIYLASDPLCDAVICVLGEKLGTPLGADIPTESLGEVAPAGGYRLVHEWKPGSEDDGGFALTGTVFEYLTALAGKGTPRTLLLLVGDRTVLTEPDPLNANWGLGHLLESASARFGSRKPDLWKWQREVYAPQLKQLSNFIEYLRARGHVVDTSNLVSNEEDARLKVRRFLMDVMNYADTADPFKGLEPYDLADRHVLFGRSDWTNAALRSFKRLWDEPERVPFFGIVGGSGVGKSSVLRAGMLGRLLEHRRYGEYRGDVIRPEDIVSSQMPAAANVEPFVPEAPLERLFVRMLAKVDSTASPAETLAQVRRLKPEHQIEAAVAALGGYLRPDGDQVSDRRLLIGLDQFEALVDLSLEPSMAGSIRHVFDFLAQCLRGGWAGVIYTLQTNRYHLLEVDPSLSPFWATGDTQPVGFPPEEALDEIIGKPFQRVGMRLAPPLHKRLRESILEFAERSPNNRANLLPLVSVQLRRLYEAASRDAASIRRMVSRKSATGTSSADKLTDDLSSYVELTLERYSEAIGIEDAIARFAEDAFDEAKHDYGYLGEPTIGDLLQPLVRLAGGTDDRIDLPAAHLGTDTQLQRLAAALTGKRLLIPEASGRVRLVHEAVLRHWGPARAWLDREIRILGLLQIANMRSRLWRERGRAPDALKGDVDEVAEILIARQRSAVGLSRLEIEESIPLEYGLALMAQANDPRRLAGTAENAQTHAYVAAWYGDVDLCAAYLQTDPTCVGATNTDKRQPLHAALFSGVFECVDLWLRAGAAVDTPDGEGWQPIHFAAARGSAVLAAHLIAAGADAAARGPHQSTALLLAAERGATGLVEMLLAQGCDPTDRFDRGTALTQAVRFGHTATVQVLLGDARCSPLDKDSDDGFTAIHLAARQGYPAVLDALRRHPDFDPNVVNRGLTPLLLAAGYGLTPVVRWLIALPNIDVGALFNGCDILHLAAEKGFTDVVDILLRHSGIDPGAVDARHSTALHHAVAGQTASTVARLLQDERVDVMASNLQGYTPLKIASTNLNRYILGLLLRDARMVPTQRDAEGWTPVLYAAEMRAAPEAWRRLEVDADFTDPTIGADFLNLAVALEDAQMAGSLLQQYHVDPWVATNRGYTALHRAIREGSRPMIELLLSTDMSHTASGSGLDVLSASAMRRDTFDILERLLEDGRFDPNVADGNGRTALHHAAMRANTDAFRRLLADPRTSADTIDVWGRTALALAPTMCHAEMAECIRDRPQ